jgi:uncharacterized Zn-binding protein involved in type VI secretion
MGKPAATVTSSTAHGTPLTGPGCPTVLINKKPAWRVLDPTPCSMTTPIGTPHAVETTIGPGSSTVMIGKLPASVMGDMLQGAGVPNSILKGCPTVLIG